MLDGFPLYCVEKLKFKKPSGLEELTPHDRELCRFLSSLRVVFNTAQLIKYEYNAKALKGYIGITPCLDLVFSCILVLFLPQCCC